MRLPILRTQATRKPLHRILLEEFVWDATHELLVQLRRLRVEDRPPITVFGHVEVLRRTLIRWLCRSANLVEAPAHGDDSPLATARSRAQSSTMMRQGMFERRADSSVPIAIASVVAVARNPDGRLFGGNRAARELQGVELETNG
jgi:hypothetical protein